MGYFYENTQVRKKNIIEHITMGLFIKEFSEIKLAKSGIDRGIISALHCCNEIAYMCSKEHCYKTNFFYGTLLTLKDRLAVLDRYIPNIRARTNMWQKARELHKDGKFECPADYTFSEHNPLDLYRINYDPKYRNNSGNFGNNFRDNRYVNNRDSNSSGNYRDNRYDNNRDSNSSGTKIVDNYRDNRYVNNRDNLSDNPRHVNSRDDDDGKYNNVVDHYDPKTHDNGNESDVSISSSSSSSSSSSISFESFEANQSSVVKGENNPTLPVGVDSIVKFYTESLAAKKQETDKLQEEIAKVKQKLTKSEKNKKETDEYNAQLKIKLKKIEKRKNEYKNDKRNILRHNNKLINDLTNKLEEQDENIKKKDEKIKEQSLKIGRQRKILIGLNNRDNYKNLLSVVEKAESQITAIIENSTEDSSKNKKHTVNKPKVKGKPKTKPMNKKTIIKHLRKISEEMMTDVCPICLKMLPDSYMKCTETPVPHRFCPTCIRGWIMKIQTSSLEKFNFGIRDQEKLSCYCPINAEHVIASWDYNFTGFRKCNLKGVNRGNLRLN